MPRRGRTGFSLAEMMIALAVLAMGLLIIGAALPLGVRYTRESINLATGEAAGEAALDTIGRVVRLRERYWPDPAAPGDTWHIYDGVYRQWGGPEEEGSDFDFIEYGEGQAAASIVQVWPLVMNNVEFSGGDDPVELPDESAFFSVLDWLDGWYTELGLTPDEVCGYVADPVMMPAVSALERVYPPVNAEVPFSVEEFDGAPYQPAPLQPGELRRVIDESMIGWTALYRRVSPATSARGQRLYEFTVITTRRPGPAYGFAVQDDASAFAQPMAALVDSVLLKRAAPVPWLVCFEELPYEGDPVAEDVSGSGPLTFKCSEEVGKLLPKGSAFFPAVISGMDATHLGVSFGGAGEKKLDEFAVDINSGSWSTEDKFDRDWAPLPVCDYPVGGYDYWCYEVDPTRGLVWKLDGREVGALSGDWGSWKDASKTWGIFESAPVTQPGGVPASQTEIGHATPGIGPALVRLPTDVPVNTLSVTVDVELSVGQSVSLGFLDEGIGLDSLSNVGRAWARVTRGATGAQVEFFKGPGESCPVIDSSTEVTFIGELTVGFDFISALEPVAYVETDGIKRGEFSLASQQSPSGLVPRVTGALPVFKVIERPDERTVIVENNGFAPWTLEGKEYGNYWPVWVIPPAYKDVDDDGQPVFESRSPVLSVTRRYLNLRSVD